MSHNTSWEYPEGVCFIEVREGGKASALSYSVYLVGQHHCKGEAGPECTGGQAPPIEELHRQQSDQKTTDFWAAMPHLNYGT